MTTVRACVVEFSMRCGRYDKQHRRKNQRLPPGWDAARVARHQDGHHGAGADQEYWQHAI